MNILSYDENLDSSLKKMIQKYWEMDEEGTFIHKVANLVKEFEISQHELLKKVKENSQLSIPGDCCEECGTFFYSKTRTEYTSRKSKMRNHAGRYIWLSTVHCKQCKEKIMANQTRERQLETEKKQLEQNEINAERKLMIQVVYKINKEERQILEERSFKESVSLLSLLRSSTSEDLNSIEPLENIQEKIFPTHDYKISIINLLHDCQAIKVSPDSPVEAFPFKDGTANTFYTLKVKWYVPASINGNTAIKALEDIFMGGSWPNKWLDEWSSFVREVALYECLEYLFYVLNAHNLSLKLGPKTLSSLEYALKSFSVSQVYSFIWRAGRDAAAYYMRGGVAKNHAANTVISSIRRQADKASAEKWEITRYRRNFDLPQTSLSKTLYDTVLQIGSKGFDEIPGTYLFGGPV